MSWAIVNCIKRGWLHQAVAVLLLFNTHSWWETSYTKDTRFYKKVSNIIKHINEYTNIRPIKHQKRKYELSHQYRHQWLRSSPYSWLFRDIVFKVGWLPCGTFWPWDMTQFDRRWDGGYGIGFRRWGQFRSIRFWIILRYWILLWSLFVERFDVYCVSPEFSPIVCFDDISTRGQMMFLDNINFPDGFSMQWIKFVEDHWAAVGQASDLWHESYTISCDWAHVVRWSVSVL